MVARARKPILASTYRTKKMKHWPNKIPWVEGYHIHYACPLRDGEVPAGDIGRKDNDCEVCRTRKPQEIDDEKE